MKSRTIMNNSGEMFDNWMEDEKKDNNKLSGVAFPIQNSDYLEIYLLEQEEIKKHKWVLSERNGKEISLQEAEWDWYIHHRANWAKSLIKISGKNN